MCTLTQLLLNAVSSAPFFERVYRRIMDEFAWGMLVGGGTDQSKADRERDAFLRVAQASLLRGPS